MCTNCGLAQQPWPHRAADEVAGTGCSDPHPGGFAAHAELAHNFGRQVFQLFKDDVIVLDAVVRQDESQVELRKLLDLMREGASAADWNAIHPYVKSRFKSSLLLAVARDAHPVRPSGAQHPLLLPNMGRGVERAQPADPRDAQQGIQTARWHASQWRTSVQDPFDKHWSARTRQECAQLRVAARLNVRRTWLADPPDDQSVGRDWTVVGSQKGQLELVQLELVPIHPNYEA